MRLAGLDLSLRSSGHRYKLPMHVCFTSMFLSCSPSEKENVLTLDGIGCADVETAQQVDAAVQLAAGVTPATIFAEFAAEASTDELRWSSLDSQDHQAIAHPYEGATTLLRLGWTSNLQSIRRYQPQISESGCPQRLEIDANLQVQTDDGAIAAKVPVALSFSFEADAMRWSPTPETRYLLSSTLDTLPGGLANATTSPTQTISIELALSACAEKSVGRHWFGELVGLAQSGAPGESSEGTSFVQIVRLAELGAPACAESGTALSR